METSPYEPFVRGLDYVRLASITAGMLLFADMHILPHIKYCKTWQFVFCLFLP